MKKVITSSFALLLILFVAPAVFAEDDKGCASSACSLEKAALAGDELTTVSGELIRSKDKMAHAAEENGMCPVGTPASGKSVLVKTEEGKMILVNAEEKINLPETIVKIRATGTMEGSALNKASIEGYCSKSEKWHTLVKGMKKENKETT